LAVDGGKLGHSPPQVQLLHRSFRLGAEIFSRRASPQRQHLIAGQSDVRLRLARDRRRALVGRVPTGQYETRSPQENHAGQRGKVLRNNSLERNGVMEYWSDGYRRIRNSITPASPFS